MAYCSSTDIIKAIPNADLIQLTDDAGTGSVDSGRVTEAIAKADAIINAYLRGKHTLPLSPVPDEIRLVSVELAKYFLYKRRRELEDDKGLETIYKHAMKILEDVRDGVILIDDAASFQNTGRIWSSSKVAADEVFSDTVLDAY